MNFFFKKDPYSIKWTETVTNLVVVCTHQQGVFYYSTLRYARPKTNHGMVDFAILENQQDVEEI